jgi:hypothetical protein
MRKSNSSGNREIQKCIIEGEPSIPKQLEFSAMR